MSKIFSTFLFALITLSGLGQDLARQGFTGLRAQVQTEGAKVARVQPSSPAENAGLKVGDVIVSVDGQRLTDVIAWERKMSVIKAGQKLQLRVNAPGGGSRDISITVAPVPLEKNKNKTEYGIAKVRDYRLRTITTVPAAPARAKLPAVLMIQWLSCESLELPVKSVIGIDSLLRAFANSDKFIFMRVDRRGSGDSEGGPCVDCGLEEELEAYRAALEQLKKRPDVDTDQIYLLGLSLGGSLAPVVGDGQNIRGYMVSGACTQTWFEHMLDIERRRLKLSGKSPGEVSEQVKRFTKFYERYYVEKMTPREIENSLPDMKGVWYDAPEHQYERPAKFYQSVQDLNVEGAWSKVDVPVLIVYGEMDWIMGLRDHTRIAEIVNERHPGLATLEVMPGLSHSLDRYKSLRDAFAGTGRVMDGSANVIFLKWIESKLNVK